MFRRCPRTRDIHSTITPPINRVFSPSRRMLPLSCRLLLDFPVLSEDGKTEMSRAVSGRVSRPDREQVLRLQALPPRGEMRGNLPRPSVSKFDSLSLSAFFLRKKRKGKGREEEGGRVVSHLAGFLHRYSYLSRRCVTKDECVKMNRLRRVYYVLEDGLAWRPFNGSCVTHCPDGYEDALDENNVRFTKKSPSESFANSNRSETFRFVFSNSTLG